MRSSPADGVDLDLVAAEAAEQAARWRAEPAAAAVEEDAERAVVATVPGADGSTTSLVALAEARAAVVATPPLGAGPAPVVLAKKAVRRATAGPLRHLADQVGALGGALASALRSLDARVGALEVDRSVVPDPLPGPDPAAVAACLEVLAGTPGPVLHAEAATGELVGALLDAGVPAIGVDPVAGRVVVARRAGRDVRLGDVAAELAGRLPGSLGAVVLSGWPDLAGPGQADAALGRLAVVLAPGGRLVVVVSERDAFARRHPVAADLAPGRPLRPATWAHLAAARGLAVEQVTEAGEGHLVVARRT